MNAFVGNFRKGDQLEREGDPARWFGFVTEGCFKYVTYGISDDREHITWFSFEGEFAGDYPACLDGRPSQTTIKAMVRWTFSVKTLKRWSCAVS